jgi:RHS repeat-associated protein
LGNGLITQKAYDAMGRNTGTWLCNNNSPDCMTSGSGTNFAAWAAMGTGRVFWRCDTVIGTCHDFPYDEFGRLAGSDSFGTITAQYVYDRYGNRWQQNSPQGGPNPNFTFNSSNNQITSSGFSYDAAGNLISDGIHGYTYDADGNILKVDNGSSAQYVYDALNRRIKTQTTNGTFEYIYDYAGRRISTWNPATTNGIEGRIYWNGAQIAYRAYNGTTYFDHQDWLGTERMRTDYAGSISSTYASLPWGDGYSANESDPSGNAQDNLHFAQLDHDTESGTEHAQFRNYSSTQGRWMSPDPYSGSYDISDPQSFNRYAYVLNKPLSFLDPFGLDCSTSTSQGCVVDVSTSPIDFMDLLEIGSIGGGGGASGHPPDLPIVQDDGGTAPTAAAGGYAPNNTVSQTPILKANDGKSIPNVPAQAQYCSAYRDGTGAGDALYQICMNFPNIPSQKWASCVRGKLMGQYVRNGNPIDLSWYLLVNHPVDFLTCPVN